MPKNLKILLVGCGQMGEAMVKSWLKARLKSQQLSIIESDREKNQTLKKKYPGTHIYSDISLIKSSQFDFIVFAIKPQIMNQTLPSYKALGHEDSIFVSIAAGKTLNFLAKHLGDNRAIIRTMPNIAAVIGQGVMVGIANHNVPNDKKTLCQWLLFDPLGKFYWVENEDDLNTVTAISGSGPAYLYYFMECWAKVGESLGLTRDLSLSLVNDTVKGAIALALETKEPLQDLRKKVTSPGGTTEAALEILTEKNALNQLLLKALSGAKERSKELSE